MHDLLFFQSPLTLVPIPYPLSLNEIVNLVQSILIVPEEYDVEKIKGAKKKPEPLHIVKNLLSLFQFNIYSNLRCKILIIILYLMKQNGKGFETNILQTQF